MRRLSVDSAVVFLTLLIIAPVAGGQTHLHITTGYGDMEQVMTVLENILTEFQKDYPELTYDIEYIGGGHLVGQIPVRTAAGLAPDIVFLWSFDFANLARQGFFLPLDSYLRTDLEDVYFPGLVDDGRVNGQLFGLPLYGGPAGINYNVDHFHSAGIAPLSAQDTWDDFVSKAKALTRDQDGDGVVDRFGFVWYSFVLRDWITWVWRNGGDIFNADRTEFLLHEPKAADALQWLADLTHVHAVTPPYTILWGSPWTYFNNETASMYPSGAWDMRRLNEQPFPNDVAPFPRAAVDRTAAEAYFVAVHAHTRYRELAAKLVEFMATSDFAQRQFYTLGNGIPFIIDAAVEYFLRPDADWNRLAYIEPLQHGTTRVMPYPANWDQVQATLRATYHQQLWSGAQPATTVGLEIKPTIDALIQDF